MTGPPATVRAFGRRSLLLAAALFTATTLAPARQSTETPSTASPSTRQHRLFARIAEGEPPPGSDWLTVLEQGETRPLLEVAAVDLERMPWEAVVYVDRPLSTAAGVELAREILTPRLAALGEIAEVQVVVAETTPRALGAPSGQADEIAVQLSLALDAEGAGQLAHLERRLGAALAATDDRDARRRRLLDHFFQSSALREWQQQSLEDFVLGTLFHGSPSRPRALFLLRDALAAPVAEVVRDLHGPERDPSLEERLYETETARQRSFARTLAALGWQVFPIRPAASGKGTGPETGPRSGTESRATPDDELATATGGLVLEGPADVELVLAQLRRTVAVRYLSPSSHGEPGPLDLRTGDPRLRLLAPRWSTGVVPDALALVRARRLLEYEEGGDLDVTAALVGELGGTATLEAGLELTELAGTGRAAAPVSPLTSDQLRITVVSERLDRDPELQPLRGSGLVLSADRWVLRAPLPTPPDLDRVVVVVEDLRTGAWGATLAEEADESPFVGDRDAVVEVAALDPPAVDGNLRPRVTTGGAEAKPQPAQSALIGEPPQPRSPQRPAVLKLVPPRGTALTGPQRFHTLLSTESIRRVQFYLDGTAVADDDKRPFEARIDLGEEVREHEVRAVAFSAGGALLGEDSVLVNRRRSRLGITLTSVDPVPGSQDVSATAELNLPRGAALDRVEFFRNEILAATVTRPPFAARLPGPARLDADFVRVVAHLQAGGFVEDVVLLGDETAGERVDVNLVEIYAVVTDKEGQPVHGLGLDHFRVRQGRHKIAIDRFAVADEVPLLLGLVVDTSESMWPIMPDTRKAAARFLGDVVSRIDRAFVVDFDNQPRLAHPISGEVFDLIAGLGRLEASGATALYDSILFAMLQFEEGLGRKAIVLLTDGDDYNSRFSFNRVQRTAASSGIPIYFIAIAGFEGGRPRYRKDDIEVIAKDSGGRVYYVTSMDQVVAAYDQIGEELRSQYVLAFATERILTDEEVRDIKVEVEGRDLEVRAVVGRDR